MSPSPKCGVVTILLVLAACGPTVGTPASGSGVDSGSTGAATGADSGSGGEDTWDSGVCGQAGDGSFRLTCDIGPYDPEPEGPPKIDVLIVVDDSPSMRTETPWLGANLLRLVGGIERLVDPDRGGTDADLQIMVMPSGAGHPLCEDLEFEPSSTSCTGRAEDFDDPQVCERTCGLDFALLRPFLVSGRPNLLSAIPPSDVDGDGEPDSELAQLLACVGQLGDRGCEYGSPLQAMARALDPGAPWNVGSEPFLRADSSLAVVLVTDGPDCSIGDAQRATSPTYMNVDPATGQPVPTPAMCHNAGTQCELVEGTNGEYYDCVPAESPLQPLQDYRDALTGWIEAGRSVSLSVVGGFPPVLEHNELSPFDPTSGGLFDITYRIWRDPIAPDGDILPAHWEQGLDAEAMQFEYGVGPGCTELTDDGGGRQSIPPLRQTELCRMLDAYDDRRRCCHESLCDDDWSFVGVCAVSTAAEDRLFDGGLLPG